MWREDVEIALISARETKEKLDLGQKTTKTQLITKYDNWLQKREGEENAEMNSISHKTKQKDDKK